MPHAQAVVSTGNENLNIFSRPLAIFGVPVDRKTIFADYKGNYKSRIEKRQRKLIVRTAFIKFFLHHNERIHCLTTGYSPITAVEQMLTGLAFLFFKRAILVFTDKRILHIPTGFDHTSQGAISQILYADCADIRLKGRTLVITYKNGREEHFPYIGRKEKRKIKVLLATLQLTPEENSEHKDRSYLCPGCTNVLEADNYMCPTCKLSFKSVSKARLRSYLIPGGGYFYSRHHYTGMLLAAAEVGVLAQLLATWICYSQGLPVNIGLAAVLVAGFLGEKLITTYHVQEIIRAYIPEPKDIAMRKL